MYQGRELLRRDECCDCVDQKAHEAEMKELAQKRKRMEGIWSTICPPLYADTDPNRLPEHFRQVLNGWEYGPKGIGLTGEAGKGKTRAAFLILRKQHLRGISCAAITMTRFAMLCVDQFSDNRDRRGQAQDGLTDVREAKLTLLDDLGKCRMTERAELELFDLLEHRTSHLLPTIWTANASGDHLLSMMSNDRGEPILRRLSEFSEIIA